MTTPLFAPELLQGLPDHTQLPCQDGTFVKNFQEPPQSTLLTGSLTPRLRELYPDGQYCIGCDSAIYWRYTVPVLDGCKAPDWYLVPGVAAMLDGELRRSYVLWQEAVRPLLLIEYVSGDGSEEHDTTPYRGKFWVYEQAIAAPYYVIFDAQQATLEVYNLVLGRYVQMSPNQHGRYPIAPLRIELGIWHGRYAEMELPWLRAWDTPSGKLLPTPEDRADLAESLLDEARKNLEEECERAENERKKKEKFAEKLRALGVDPDSL